MVRNLKARWRVLLVNNGTSYLEQLRTLLSGCEVTVVAYSDIDLITLDSFDVIVLSGGHAFFVDGNSAKLSREIDLVRRCPKPILGICYGFEVIAQTYGAKLELMSKKEHGFLDIQITKPGHIFQDMPLHFQVFESHRWVIKKVDSQLIELARSKDGVEAFKHKKKPIYAVQFHPEMFVEKSCGEEIFHNFLKSIHSSNSV